MMKGMDAEQVIEQIRSLSLDDLHKVERVFIELKGETEADVESARRIQQLRSGVVAPISEEEALSGAKAELSEG